MNMILIIDSTFYVNIIEFFFGNVHASRNHLNISIFSTVCGECEISTENGENKKKIEKKDQRNHLIEYSSSGN